MCSDYASGEMPAGQRHVLLQHLGRLDQGQLGLLANARYLAEGVDVPTLDGVALIDPRRASTRRTQRCAMRRRRAYSKSDAGHRRRPRNNEMGPNNYVMRSPTL